MALPTVAAVSSATNNGSSLSAFKVKHERRDDDEEIDALAAKMVEANKAKMPGAVARPPGTNGTAGQVPSSQQMVTSNQPAILNFLTRSGAPPAKPQQAPTTNPSSQTPTEKPPCDADSVKMHFGWVTLGKLHIPYILRYGSEKYCAVRMVEMKLLSKYLTYLHADIYSCTCIRSYYITDAEARLLNDINVRHCDYQFGREPFTTKDLVVRLQDADEFYSFLDVCYNKLVPQQNSAHSNKCGFIRIDGESVVPYILRNGTKYVPVFYFEGEISSLFQKSETLKDWDLAYLKFCCKVQGIRAELFEKDNCSVISLEDIKGYFPAETNFEDYWPSKVVDRQLLVSTAKSDSSATWTITPSVSVPSQSPAMNKVPAGVNSVPRQPAHSASYMTQSMTNGWNGLVGGQPTYHNSSNRMSMMHNGSMQMGMVSPGSAVQPPPPLVRVTASQPTMGRSSAAAAMYSSAGNSLTHMMGMSQHSSQMLPPQQPHAHYPPAPANYKNPPPLVSAPQSNQRHHHVSNGKSQSSMDRVRLIQIPDYPSANSSHTPFKIQKALVEGKMVPCMNAKPFVYTELLMTLQDLTSHFFPQVTLSKSREILQEVLKLGLYRANRDQMLVLKQHGKCQSSNDTVPLVQVKDVMQYMPQIKYMFAAQVRNSMMGQHAEEPPAKMKRTS